MCIDTISPAYGGRKVLHNELKVKGSQKVWCHVNDGMIYTDM